MMTTRNVTRAEWDRLTVMFVEAANKAVGAVKEVVDSFRRAFDTAFNDPKTRAVIMSIFDQTRYARSQGRRKPRGRRAKRESAAAWRAHLDMLRLRRMPEGEEMMLTAGALRAMGHIVPTDVPDDVLMRVTRRLEGETLHVQIDMLPKGHVGQVECTVRIDGLP